MNGPLCAHCDAVGCPCCVRRPELRSIDRAAAALPRLTEAVSAAREALQRGDTAEALVHVQAAKAEGSGLWSELDGLGRQLEARTRMARVVRDVEDELAGRGR